MKIQPDILWNITDEMLVREYAKMKWILKEEKKAMENIKKDK